MKTRILIFLLYLPVIYIFTSCKKNWLDQKSDKGLSVPQTPADFQAIMDNPLIMNRSYCHVGNRGTDNIFIADVDAGSFGEQDLNQYLWEKDIPWYSDISYIWNYPFSVIETANIVLEGIEKSDQQDPTIKGMKGQALFYRAYAYYSTAQVFCQQYNSATANTALGLPLRTTSDVNQLVQRSNLQQVYDMILSDLQQAADMLPESSPYFTRPTKVSALAMLSRVYLNMQNYKEAKSYADATLAIKSELIDFNNNAQVSSSKAYRFPVNGIGNPEILFYGYKPGNSFENSYLGSAEQANPELYNLFEDNDLRKTFFFGKSATKLNFISSYTGARPDFAGLATNEIYLIRAEASARLGLNSQARADLNKLLQFRFKTGTAPNITEDNDLNLLRKILLERRKELPHTGNTRWEDLRRLNLEPDFALTLTRTFKGKQYSIAPNSPRYVLPIANSEIRLSGIEQNPR